MAENVEQAVRRIHSERVFNGDGYGWAICVEDRQAWPCATIQAVEAVLNADEADR